MTLATTKIDRAAVTGLIAHCSRVASVYRKRWDYYLQGPREGCLVSALWGGGLSMSIASNSCFLECRMSSIWVGFPRRPSLHGQNPPRWWRGGRSNELLV